MVLKIISGLLGGVFSYSASMVFLTVLFPKVAVSDTNSVEYFVGETIRDCVRSCSFNGDIISVDEGSVIRSLIKNKHYSSGFECNKVVDYYKFKILNLNYFPLYSKSSDFGGLFEINKTVYHAKLKCNDNFMLASISKINK